MTACKFSFFSMSSLLIFKFKCLKWQFATNYHILVKNTIKLVYERMTQASCEPMSFLCFVEGGMFTGISSGGASICAADYLSE